MMDVNTSVSQGFGKKLQDNSHSLRQQMVAQMQTAPSTPSTRPTTTPVASSTAQQSPAANEDNPLIPSPPAITTKKPTQGILTSAQRDALTIAKGLAEEAVEERQQKEEQAKKPIAQTARPATKAMPKPIPKPAVKTPINTSVKSPSAATIDLATNRPELTIETISKEARRIEEKEKLPENGEVFISLH